MAHPLEEVDPKNPPAVFTALLAALKGAYTIASVQETLPAFEAGDRRYGWEEAVVQGRTYEKFYFARPDWGVGYAGAVVCSPDIALTEPRQYQGPGQLKVIYGVVEVRDRHGRTIASLVPGDSVYEMPAGTIGYLRFVGVFVSLAEKGIKPIDLPEEAFPPSNWAINQWEEPPAAVR